MLRAGFYVSKCVLVLIRDLVIAYVCVYVSVSAYERVNMFIFDKLLDSQHPSTYTVTDVV